MIFLVQGWLAHLVCHLAPCFPWNSSCGWFKLTWIKILFKRVSTSYKFHSGGRGHVKLSTHWTRLSQVSRLPPPVLILWHHLWSGWWVATLPRGAGAWRRWRCIMTQGNIDMECPTQGYQLFFDHLMKYLWSLNPVLAFTVTLRQCETCIRDVDEKLRVPETFYMLLDMDRGTLAFQVNILEC